MAEALRRTKYPRWLTSLIEGLQSTYRTNCLRCRGPLLLEAEEPLQPGRALLVCWRGV